MRARGQIHAVIGVMTVAAALLALPVGGTGAQAGVAQPTLVRSTPVRWTPHIKTGMFIHDQAVVHGTVWAGGRFTRVENAKRTRSFHRRNFFGYSVTTGAVSPVVLNVNGDVLAVAGRPHGHTLYVGGQFSTVNGATRRNLVKIKLPSGRVDRSFTWSGGVVRDLQVANGRVYVGGDFQKRLVALNPKTGHNTGEIKVSVSGNVGGSPTRVDQFSINPQGTDLVALGNFTTVNNKPRRLAFRLSLSRHHSRLRTWHPVRFNSECLDSLSYYLRGVDWSPNGSYFVIVSTGGPAGGYPMNGFCDATGRWEASSSGSDAQPTWINWTGGDSLYSVAVSGAAVYVGGHQRWLDNPLGHDSEGPGAYRVDSIGAIDPATGQAIRSWDARPMTRGHGKEDLTLYGGGLVIGGDGNKVDGKYHRMTAIFPLS